jgi:cell division protein FtsQ
MAKHKQPELTPRQRQSQKIMRDKERKRRREHWVRKLQIGGAIIAGVLSVGGGAWVWHTSAVSRLLQATADKIYEATADAGYVVQNLYLEGRNRTPMDAINTALDIDKGMPIFSLSLSDVRTRLEAIESIKSASVERGLPDTLYVRITEREPVALWQYQGAMALVDDNGAVMKGLDRKPYQELPLIVGEDAPKHVSSLLDMLGEQPELARRFSSAIWVGKRRWNLRLTQQKPAKGKVDIEVRLPEENPGAAWARLAKMQAEDKLLDRDVLVIDLRIDGRLFITYPEEEPALQPKNKSGAKET